MKKFGLILLALLSANCIAGEWTQPLTVKDVSFSIEEGRFGGVAQLRATFDELPTTNVCKPNETLAVYATGNANNWAMIWSSILLSAQAQNKKVQIYTFECYVDNIPRLSGVRIVRDN